MRILTNRSHFKDEDFPLAVCIRDPQPEFPVHSHQFYELVFITRGSGLHKTGSHRFSVSAGDVFVIPKNQEHEYRNVQDLSLINIIFDPVALGLADWDVSKIPGFHVLFNFGGGAPALQTPLGRQHISPHQMENAKRLIQQLSHELTDRPCGFQRMAVAYFTQLIIYISRSYEQDDDTPPSELLRVGQALAHIEQHYDQQISLAEVAKAACMSERNLRRIFTKAVGMPPSRYLQQIRVAHAASLLESTARSITDIAFACGFEDSNYFSRQFRLLMNKSPRDYRNR